MSEQGRDRRISPSDLWAIPRVGHPAPAPDGSFVITSVTTFVGEGNDKRERLFLLRRGAPPRPLTAPDTVSSNPVVSPDGHQLAFLRKPHGSDHPQLFVMPLDGGEARQITDLPLGAADPRWLPDGKGIIVRSSLYRGALTVEETKKLRDERAKIGARPNVTEDRVYRFWDHWITDGEIHHLFLVDVESGSARDLLPTSERWFDLFDPDGEYDISPGGTEIAFSANSTSPPYTLMRAAIYTVPLAGGEPVCITPDNPADDKRPRYSPDGRYLVYGKKHDIENYADRVRLVRLDRRTGEHHSMTAAWDRSPSAWEFSGAHTLVIEAETQGRTCLYRMNVASEAEPEVIARGGSLHGISTTADGAVYAQHQTLTRPPEIVRCSLQGDDIERISHFTDEAMAGITLGRVEEITFPGAGGDSVHMYVVYPPGYDGSRRYPLVHSIHGGPYGIHADAWHLRWNAQTFAAPGYVVAMVNFHGSSSYGQRFSDAILGDWGGKAAEDILLATDLLVARGIADPSRMAIAGGSFGGYMVCWLSTQTDRFACSIAHAAVFNVRSMCASDVTQGIEKEIGGEPWDLPRAREAVDRWDPAAHTESYRTPTLVLHGGLDYRVPVEQGLELYGMLKAKGVPARLVHYPDENHWILKKSNSLHWYGEFQSWLARYLGPRE